MSADDDDPPDLTTPEGQAFKSVVLSLLAEKATLHCDVVLKAGSLGIGSINVRAVRSADDPKLIAVFLSAAAHLTDAQVQGLKDHFMGMLQDAEPSHRVTQHINTLKPEPDAP